MRAGTGVTHSEYNPSDKERVHFLQIWVMPERKGLTPGYEQKYLGPEEKRGRLRLIASRDGQEGSVTIHQDVRVLAGLLTPGEEVVYAVPGGRRTWLQVARGTLLLNGSPLKEGDGAAVSAESSLHIIGKDEAELLIFDLA